ncbi:hypothetical protein O3M35_008185 [Rhynocoris fuscipes]|uniref:Uncharacterized protein n=1 Tax=Rhynocoris fuscipes TaxID=488301 RepID=A0AAW1D5G4_9HEMI
MTAPLTADYDKMRLLHKVGRTTTFEETIHRLKVQEALKKKERIDREHEETRAGGMSVTQILRDIRAGVLVGSSHICSSTGGGGPSSRQATSSAASHPDDTYMYDDEMSRIGQQHWYDEPPYESDPEDFLMQADSSPPVAVALHNSRLCFTMRTSGEDCIGGTRASEVSEVISLRSAGDISLPSQQRTLLVPCHTSRSNRNNRESGDYAASDVNSICSRLSSLSMETSRSEHLEMDVYHRLRSYNGVEPTISPGHSSDYAEHDELVSSLQAPSCGGGLVTTGRSRKCGDSSSSSSKSLGRRHHHHHHHHHHHVHHRQPRPHHSSAESLPSASSTQALVSNMEEYSPQGAPLIPLARALVDAQPNHYDPDALRFKKGDIIEVLKMSKSGVWRGRVHGRTGHFKFINVELLSPGMPSGLQTNLDTHHPPSKQHRMANRPLTLEEMLTAIHMEEHMSLFVLNGYEDLESFCEIREEDLDYLGLTDPEHRAKILAAVQVLHEFEQTEEEWTKKDPSVMSKDAANNLSQLNIQSHSGIEPGLSDSTSFLPNIPVNSSSDPPPLPAPSGPVQPPACVLTPQTPQSGGNSGGCNKGGSSDSGVSSSSAGSSVRGSGGNSRPRPPPPPKPGSATPDSPSYVNHVVIEAANGTNNAQVTSEAAH